MPPLIICTALRAVMIYQACGLDKKEATRSGCFFLEVQAGFEPADNGVADRGLTTWLLHQTDLYFDIIANLFLFVNRKKDNLSKELQKSLKKLFLHCFGSELGVKARVFWVVS